jgi:putative salt-induced outer membrane protein
MFDSHALRSRSRARRVTLLVVAAALPPSFAASAEAQIVAGPPPDATAIVAAPKGEDVPKLDAPPNGTSVTLSAGGQLATGNSRLLAITGSGVYASRYGANGFGASILGNYGQGAPPGSSIVETAENLQGRIRYDRYVLDHMSLFLIGTGRHDRFQGLDVRFNVDPGVKYIFVDEKTTSFWGEAGYDFQYDIRDADDLGVTDPTTMAPVDYPGTTTQELITRTASDHSARLFVGLRHAFNDAVTFSTGLEYLQSFYASKDPNNASATGTDSRINYDALFAAKVGGGLSIGFGFTARYDHHPIPGKESLDTTTSVNLIYGFSDLPKPPVDCSQCQAPLPPTGRSAAPTAVEAPMSVTSPQTPTAPVAPPPSSSAPPPPPPAPTPAPSGSAPAP